VVLVHVDTDIGGDPDDACALAMLLGWPGIDITGITTNLEADGRRAACAGYVLKLAGRENIPIAAGANASMTDLRRFEPTFGDERHWPEPFDARPSPAGAALDLLAASIARDATIVAIGGLTNLALLEVMRPGVLRTARIVAMAGWLAPPSAGLPQWGPDMDFNVQCDPRAAEIVAVAADDLTLVTLPVTMRAHLRARDLVPLRSSGPIGALLARQSEVNASDANMSDLARTHPALPDDLVNFHWDPVTCAVAAGWAGATIESKRLRVTRRDGVVVFEEGDDGDDGHDVRVVIDLDIAAFTDVWLSAVQAADAAAIANRAG
jgi:inosine-uridine nucleoside N-ribohydrolase